MKQQIFFIIFILMMIISGPAFSSDAQERLDTSAFDTPRRPGAVFSHDDHNEQAGISDNCEVCHHVYEKKVLVPDESSEDQACSDCHGLKPGPENGISLIRAFHGRCKDCHFKINKGPVLCGQCHTNSHGPN